MAILISWLASGWLLGVLSIATVMLMGVMVYSYNGISPDRGSLRSRQDWESFVDNPETGLSDGYLRNRKIDTVFPLVYGLALVSLSLCASMDAAWLIVPIAAVLADYTENILIARATRAVRHGTLGDRLVHTLAWLPNLKFFLVFLAALVPIVKCLAD